MNRQPPESIKQPLFPIENRRHLAPCQGARRLLIIAIGATLVVVFAVATDLVLRTENDTASQWMKQLTLFTPASQTAGAPMRHPETIHPGVDLRYGAGLEIFP